MAGAYLSLRVDRRVEQMYRMSPSRVRVDGCHRLTTPPGFAMGALDQFRKFEDGEDLYISL
jgi:hypothetical protein